MNVVLFDDHAHEQLKPFTFTKAVGDLRLGILTIREKWELLLKAKTTTVTALFLQERYPLKIEEDNLLINAAMLPSNSLLKELLRLDVGQKLVKDERLIGLRIDRAGLEERLQLLVTNPHYHLGNLFTKMDGSRIRSDFEVLGILHPWDLFRMNSEAITSDFNTLTAGRKSETLSSTNRIVGTAVFLEEGAVVQHASLNSSTGPIYVGKNAEIMEGSMIRGGFALGEASTVKMGAKIYGPTTIGPHCKVGGEISNSVMLGYSNKGHDGFIGNSVIGEWCNLGADTNSSNLKNNYGEVDVWNYAENKSIASGLQFCGVLMGDHTKTGINTMLNTGTVIGVSSNIFGSNFPPKFIPSFSWGGDGNWHTFRKEKAVEVATRMMERRGITFTKADRALFDVLFDQSASLRSQFVD
jgi:UDP-N-acetylglucosamine diphosphorylase/glucosamine-1-phosphate N-acetyltransferase